MTCFKLEMIFTMNNEKQECVETLGEVPRPGHSWELNAVSMVSRLAAVTSASSEVKRFSLRVGFPLAVGMRWVLLSHGWLSVR
jgi:hypothetical protein